MRGIKLRFRQTIGYKSINHPAHTAAILFNQIKLVEDGGDLFVAQVRFVVAGFDLFNGQAVQQGAGVKEFDSIIINLDGGVVGAAVVTVHNHLAGVGG